MCAPRGQTITRIELAEMMLDDARLCFEDHRYRSAISRAYYCCYHAARACLEQLEFDVARRMGHDACLQLFSLYFIRPGTFPREAGKRFNRLRALRTSADYELAPIDRQQAHVALMDAADFLKEVKDKWDVLGST